MSDQPATQQLRNVYTCAQFATEILCGNHTDKWVQRQCKGHRIRVVARRPWLIPRAEAERFINGK